MEIVVRSVIVFVFVWVLTRALGKRELGELSAFELVLLVIFGDLVQQGVTQEDMSVTGAVLAVGTMGVMVLATSYVAFRWKRMRPPLEGFPVIVIRGGRFIEQALRAERVTPEEVIGAARQHGIADLADVEVGILEAEGKFTFLTTERQDESAAIQDRKH